MGLKLQQIFRHLEPYRVVSDLGLKIEKREDDIFMVSNPWDTNEKLAIMEAEFLSDDPKSDIISCDVFDFLALYKTQNYRDNLQFGYACAIDHVLQNYADLADNTFGVSLIDLRENFIQEAFSKRTQFLNITGLKNHLRDKESFTESAGSWFRRNSLVPDHLSRMLYICQGRHLNKILSCGANEDDTYIVYPYFIDSRTISSLSIQSVIKEEEEKQIVLIPSRYSYFGLHTGFSSSLTKRLYAGRMDSIRFQSFDAECGKYKSGHISIQHVPQAQDYDNQLDRGIFMQFPGLGFGPVSKARLAVKNLRVAINVTNKFAASMASIPWFEFAIMEFKAVLDPGFNITHSVADFADAIKNDRNLCRMILDWLKKHKQDPLYQFLKRRIDSRHLIQVKNYLEISETDNGYKALNTKTGAAILFTNFVVHIDSLAWFESSDEEFYHGRILMKNEEAPFCIAKAKLDKPKEIETLAASAIIRHLGVSASTPMIFDNTFRSHLGTIIRHNASNKPRQIGVDKLGWNVSRTKFITPSWQASMQGIAETSHLPHPASDLLNRHYSFKTFDLDTVEKLAPGINSYISLLVSMIVRAYLDLHVPPVRVARSGNMLNFLSSLFIPLGQSSPFALNANRRHGKAFLNFNDVCAFPIYGSSADPEIADNFNLPMFLLSESGLDFGLKIEPVKYRKIYSATLAILQKLIVALLKSNKEAYVVCQTHTSCCQSLMLEGQKLIQHYCEMPDFEVEEFKEKAPPNVSKLFPGKKIIDTAEHSDIPDSAV